MMSSSMRSSFNIFRLLISHAVLSGSTLLTGASNLDKIPTQLYLRHGDLYLGGLVVAHDFSPSDFCTDRVTRYEQLMFAQVWALNKVNSDPTILPNITLGLALVDACFNRVVALGQALRFGMSQDDVGRCSFGGLQSLPQIVGLIGPVTSGSAIPTSNMMTLFKIPIIGAVSSSDELSDKVKHPYFFRVLPPDRYLAQALVSLLNQFGWTYISIVYEETAYGFNGMKAIRAYSQKVGLCIADTLPLSEDFVEYQDYFGVVNKLRKNPNSRAIVIFGVWFRIRNLLKAVQALGGQGEFLWVTGENIREDIVRGLEDVAQGAFGSMWYSEPNPELEKYITTLSPWEDPLYPWLKDSWRNDLGCDLEKTSKMEPRCLNYTLKDLPGFQFNPLTTHAANTVFAFARAIDTLISERCPEARQNKRLLASCVEPGKLVEYVRNVVLPTPNGDLSFDENGDMIRDYLLQQLQKKGGHYKLQPLGVWKSADSRFDINLKDLQWNEHEKFSNFSPDFPESLCARPCTMGEFFIQGELPCCWKCHVCRDNEYVAENGTACRACHLLTWPDQQTKTSCLTIDPNYMSWDDPYGAGLTAMAALGMLTALSVIRLVLKYRDRKVIKGANWELITVILFGVLIALSTVPLFITKPTYVVCLSNRLGFNICYTLIFGPLLVKTNRIYQVFRAASKLSRSVRLAGTASNIVIMLVVCALQAGLCVATIILWPVTAARTMPVTTEPYVELQCDQDLKGLLIPLAFNILLIFICAIFAFLTRKLPDNFNESWYIFLCVSTTLFVWIAFFPTYFTAFYAYHKAALLAFALILNAAVTLICLFGPKIYALYYVNEDDIKVTDFSQSATRGGQKTEETSVKNAPSPP